MSDLTKQYELWDEFLRAWPLTRLSAMTLDEYSHAGSKDSFTYWIESRLDALGSIWGGSAFKFGVFSRKDTEDKKSDTKLSYSETHGWYSSLGANEHEAFEKVRGYVAQVAALAARGDLDGIERFGNLGEAYKWKIAFHYQDRSAPTIVDIFLRAPLSAFVGGVAGRGMAELQRAALAKRPAELGILEFGHQIWSEWSNKNLDIWKLSHGDKDFTEPERKRLIEEQLAVMHSETGLEQGKKFVEVPVGTLFFLCHGNSPQRVCQFTSHASPSSKGTGWIERKYRVLKLAVRTGPYADNSKKWSPRGNSTFWQVGAHDLPEFEGTLLSPYFGTTLAELAGMVGEPIETANAKVTGAKPLSDEEVLQHFDGKEAFRLFRNTWTPQDRVLFCRLARAVHAAGMDWWHMSRGIQVRFGRKNMGSDRAMGVLGIVRGTRARKLSWMHELGEMPKLNREAITEEWVAKIEAALSANGEALNRKYVLDEARSGLWPDQLSDDQSDPEDDSDDEDTQLGTTSRKPFNRIYYGPPGTGKTYQLRALLKKSYEQATHTVAAEEWRSKVIAERIAVLKWWEVAAAALYDRGGQAKVSDLASHPFIEALVIAKGSNRNVRSTLWRTLQNHTVEGSATVNLKERLAPAVFDKSAESVWHFAGEWKDDCQDLIELVEQLKAGPPAAGAMQRYSFVTFHQSYGYEEFIEGLRPLLDDDVAAGEIQYEIRPGVFKELCRKARLAPEQRFAMVIDEINRGNISKIFGELITLIEPDKREGGENEISVTLPYSGEPFLVPANVDIIGTMNTADRSLALLDTALRRRFDFVPLMPDSRDEVGAPLHGLRVVQGDKIIDIPRLLSAINQRVEALYDRDHTVGHAYFTSLKQVPDGEERFSALVKAFRNRIVPLLEEYFFEDWQKIRLVLADNQKAEAARFISESEDHEEDLTRLFGGNHELDSFTTRRRYAVQESAFTNPDAYIGIYESLVL